VITHCVMFRFADRADAVEGKARLARLVGRVPSLLSLWAGVDDGRTEQSFDLALVTTHATWEDLRAYDAHPDHVAAKAFLLERATAGVVVDAAD
jgi:Stress responsive A/B Barrel Domain